MSLCLALFHHTVCLSLQVFIFSRSEVAPGVFECWGNFAEHWGLKAYVTWMTLAVFILPVLIITVCQVGAAAAGSRTRSHHEPLRDEKNVCQRQRANGFI